MILCIYFNLKSLQSRMTTGHCGLGTCQILNTHDCHYFYCSEEDVEQSVNVTHLVNGSKNQPGKGSATLFILIHTEILGMAQFSNDPVMRLVVA